MGDRNVYEILEERGFIYQTTHEDEIRKMLDEEKVTFYIGMDPTADSLHVGHFLTIMAMAHLQRAGHRPIVVVGGGTGMVGDVTNRTDMRRLMSKEEVDHNISCFKKQLSNFIDFDDDKALIIDNGDWLLKLNYIDFIREYGVHFSVNRMLTADSYKTRFEEGLTFFEFNYMLLQAYDYLKLYRDYDCKLQIGGSDQWSNIIAGVDLIRRVEDEQTYGVTFNLLVKSDGEKMGKSLGGAVWLDPEKTPPYDFYQYWRNVEDTMVIDYLKLLTFLPMEEIEELGKLEGKEINKAKEVLAFELTKIVHGEEEAKKAENAAKALFAGGVQEGSIPTTEISKEEVEEGITIIELLEKAKLIPSRGEGRRLIEQGGIRLNGERVESHDFLVTKDNFTDNELMLQRGRKVHHRIEVK